MSETKDLLRRGGEGFAPREGIMDSLLRRRDRKRRNQRITAGVVGITVFVAAVWIVTSVGSFDRTQTPALPGGAETGPAVTGPAEIASPRAPASAAPEDTVIPGTCSDGASMVVELTDMGDRINARFVLHQMTLPGHYWRIVLKHTNTHLDFADPVDWRVFFEGTKLATGDSGYITVQQSFVDSDSWFVVMAAKARERQTGQLCRLAVDWAHG